MSSEKIEWGQLSNRAKNVLEWLIEMNDSVRNVISVDLDKPASIGSNPRRRINRDIVDRELFDEIRTYVTSNEGDFETLEIADNSMILKLTEEAAFGPSGVPSP